MIFESLKVTTVTLPDSLTLMRRGVAMVLSILLSSNAAGRIRCALAHIGLHTR